MSRLALERMALAPALGLSAADMALLLLLAGILLIYAEFNRPGTILLGAAGALLFLLGALALLPLSVSWAAAGLIGLSLAVLLWSVRFPMRSWHATYALASTLAIIAGLRYLVNSSVHWVIAILAGGIFGSVTYTLGRIAILAARNKRLPVANRAAQSIEPPGTPQPLQTSTSHKVD